MGRELLPQPTTGWSASSDVEAAAWGLLRLTDRAQIARNDSVTGIGPPVEVWQLSDRWTTDVLHPKFYNDGAPSSLEPLNRRGRVEAEYSKPAVYGHISKTTYDYPAEPDDATDHTPVKRV